MNAFTRIYAHHLHLGADHLTVSYVPNEVLTFSDGVYHRILLGEFHPPAHAATSSISRVGNTVAIAFRPEHYNSTYFVTFCDLSSQNCSSFASSTEMGPGKLLSASIYGFFRPGKQLAGLKKIESARGFTVGPNNSGLTFGRPTIFNLTTESEQELTECGTKRTIVISGLGTPHLASLEKLLLYSFYATWNPRAPGQRSFTTRADGVPEWLRVSLDREGSDEDRRICISSVSVLDEQPIPDPFSGRFLSAGATESPVEGATSKVVMLEATGSAVSLFRSSESDEIIVGFQMEGQAARYSTFRPEATIKIEK